MVCLNLLAVDIKYVGQNKNYDMLKELCKRANKICREWQKTEKICLDPESDPDG